MPYVFKVSDPTEQIIAEQDPGKRSDQTFELRPVKIFCAILEVCLILNKVLFSPTFNEKI